MTITLFLTEKTSLALWERAGFLGRGVLNYNRLAAHCDQFYFVTYGGAEELRYQHLFARNCVILPNPYAWMPLRLYGVLSPFIHLRALRGADVFYSGQMQGAWSAVIAKYLLGKKFVLNCGYQWLLFARVGGENILKRACIFYIEWLTYRAADHIVVSSASARTHVHAHYNIPLFKIDVIPNYIDTDAFQPLAVPRDEKSIIFVGRLEPQKNLGVLFEALRGSGYALTVAGMGSLEDQLKEKARVLGIAVTFIGVIPNAHLPREFNRHAVFVLPSLYEGSPKTLLEAMACGMPVVACDAPGVREIIQHGVNGFLCAPEPRALRAAIDAVFADLGRASALGRAAREYVLRHCSLDQKISREVLIFNAVCR